MIRKTALALSLAVSCAALPGIAEEYEVQMLTSGPDGELMVFEPAFLQIEPGDSVTFVPADPGHNAETIDGMLPEDAEPFKGAINEEISVTFEQEGLYGYKCAPHFAMGMVGLIKVGASDANTQQAQSVTLPPEAEVRMVQLFEHAAGDGQEVSQ